MHIFLDFAAIRDPLQVTWSVQPQGQPPYLITVCWRSAGGTDTGRIDFQPAQFTALLHAMQAVDLSNKEDLCIS